MGDLDPGHGTTLGDDGSQAGKQRLMFRGVETQAMRRDTADVGDMRRLGHDDAGATGRPGTQVLDVPVVAQSVIGAVLAHWRHDDAVASGDRAETDRLKEQRR